MGESHAAAPHPTSIPHPPTSTLAHTSHPHPTQLRAQAAVAARNKALEALVQEATTRPLPCGTEEIKRIDLREAGERSKKPFICLWGQVLRNFMAALLHARPPSYPCRAAAGLSSSGQCVCATCCPARRLSVRAHVWQRFVKDSGASSTAVTPLCTPPPSPSLLPPLRSCA